MQGLVWRLKALDAEASESLKVIAYFDALVDGHASAQVLLSGAAVLSGCAAGYVAEGGSLRVDASGSKTDSGEPGTWPGHDFSDGGRVWIERTGQAFANDEMILERVAIALGISFDRTSPVAASRRAIETIIDGTAPLDRRMDAAAMLRLDREKSYRVVAVPASTELPGPSAVVYTGVGPVRASVLRLSGTESSGAPPDSRWGGGLAMVPAALDRSWASALLALRLTSHQHPRQLADDLGSLLVFAELADLSRLETPDLTALKRLLQVHPKALVLLESVAASNSLRAVAEEIGLHHSTVQSRTADYSTALGFDIRTAPGRVRLSLVLTLFRLSTTTFGQ
jgi:hypothetical protein